jgi:phage anti-repressor protein
MFFPSNTRMNLNVSFSQENDLVVCNDMEALEHQHNTPEWHLFIDSSKVSFSIMEINTRQCL